MFFSQDVATIVASYMDNFSDLMNLSRTCKACYAASTANTAFFESSIGEMKFSTFTCKGLFANYHTLPRCKQIFRCFIRECITYADELSFDAYKVPFDFFLELLIKSVFSSIQDSSTPEQVLLSDEANFWCSVFNTYCDYYDKQEHAGKFPMRAFMDLITCYSHDDLSKRRIAAFFKILFEKGEMNATQLKFYFALNHFSCKVHSIVPIYSDKFSLAHVAVWSDNEHLIKVLASLPVKYGRSVFSMVDNVCRNPLHYAYLLKNTSMVQLLKSLIAQLELLNIESAKDRGDLEPKELPVLPESAVQANNNEIENLDDFVKVDYKRIQENMHRAYFVDDRLVNKPEAENNALELMAEEPSVPIRSQLRGFHQVCSNSPASCADENCSDEDETEEGISYEHVAKYSEKKLYKLVNHFEEHIASIDLEELHNDWGEKERPTFSAVNIKRRRFSDLDKSSEDDYKVAKEMFPEFFKQFENEDDEDFDYEDEDDEDDEQPKQKKQKLHHNEHHGDNMEQVEEDNVKKPSSRSVPIGIKQRKQLSNLKEPFRYLINEIIADYKTDCSMTPLAQFIVQDYCETVIATAFRAAQAFDTSCGKDYVQKSTIHFFLGTSSNGWNFGAIAPLLPQNRPNQIYRMDHYDWYIAEMSEQVDEKAEEENDPTYVPPWADNKESLAEYTLEDDLQEEEEVIEAHKEMVKEPFDDEDFNIVCDAPLTKPMLMENKIIECAIIDGGNVHKIGLIKWPKSGTFENLEQELNSSIDIHPQFLDEEDRY